MKRFALFAVVLLGVAQIVRYLFDAAGWDSTGWQFAAVVGGLGSLVWMALPLSLLERLRIVPRWPPLSATGQPGDIRKLSKSFLLDRAIRQDPSER